MAHDAKETSRLDFTGNILLLEYPIRVETSTSGGKATSKRSLPGELGGDISTRKLEACRELSYESKTTLRLKTMMMFRKAILCNARA